MPLNQFKPGFRISSIDVVVLISGIALSSWIATFNVGIGIGIAIAFVVAHFFLFCNILRMPRSFELIWAGTFVLLTAVCLSAELMTWPIVFAVSVLLTLVLTAIAVKRPDYHGVGWQRINPSLPHWWANHMARTRDLSSGTPIGASTGEA